jgi:hypothetical protein
MDLLASIWRSFRHNGILQFAYGKLRHQNVSRIYWRRGGFAGNWLWRAENLGRTCMSVTLVHSKPGLLGLVIILYDDVEPQDFTFPWNKYHQGISDIELIQISVFFFFLSLLYSKTITCFTAVKQSEVSTWQSTRGHLIKPIVASIVYGTTHPISRRERRDLMTAGIFLSICWQFVTFLALVQSKQFHNAMVLWTENSALLLRCLASYHVDDRLENIYSIVTSIVHPPFSESPAIYPSGRK